MRTATEKPVIMNDVARESDVAGVTSDHRFFWGFPTFARIVSLIGPLLVALACCIAGGLGIVIYAPFGPSAAIGVALGAMAVVAMSQTLILATRSSLLEPLFGGLDRMYQVHKWLGISALVLMILHDQFEPDFDRTVRETNLGDFASDLGEFAFNAFLALIVISWFRRLPFIGLEIPYQLWRFSHRFMGVFFAIVVFHQFFVDMPTVADQSLSWLLNIFGIAGLVAWLHIEFIAPRLRRRTFKVSAISRHADTTSLTLAPDGRAMRWRPGQFAFISAPDAGLSEPHPFTISSAPRSDGTLHLSIRALGGWTRRLPNALREGMLVDVEGPYGRFDFRTGGRQQIWLAGGVGITPFIAWAESLTEAEQRKIHLVYCVRTQEDAIELETLRAAALRTAKFSFEVIATAQDGRLTAERLSGSAPFPIREADLWFCGPTGLKNAILKDLKASGQTPRRVRYEHFTFA